MTNIGKRIEALEASAPVASGIMHRLIHLEGESLDEAITSYGRELIGPTDRLIVRRIVRPSAKILPFGPSVEGEA